MEVLTGKVKDFLAIGDNVMVEECEFEEISNEGMFRADSDQKLLKVGRVTSVGNGKELIEYGLDKLKKGDIVIYRELGRDTWGAKYQYLVDYRNILGFGVPKNKKPNKDVEEDKIGFDK